MVRVAACSWSSAMELLSRVRTFPAQLGRVDCPTLRGKEGHRINQNGSKRQTPVHRADARDKSLLYRQPELPIAGRSTKPSDGLEPSTPSLPWRRRAASSVMSRQGWLETVPGRQAGPAGVDVEVDLWLTPIVARTGYALGCNCNRARGN
jgi:hypothetical protein